MKRTLRQLQQWLQVEGQHVGEQIVRRATIDSRDVREGDLFIPFRGERANGHQYVRQAIEKGAVASLWLADEPNPPGDIPLLFVEDSEEALQTLARAYRTELDATFIGVTGSNGKTSTKDLIDAVLSPYMHVQKTEGNFNNELGMPLTILALEEDVEVAVLEMGMSGFGEISLLSDIARPNLAVITNIGEAHMEELGSRNGIAQAKFEIIDGLQKDGLLLYDGGEPLLQSLVQQSDCLAKTFGYDAQFDFVATDVEEVDGGTAFRVIGSDMTFTLPVYGRHQVQNALAAIGIARHLGLSDEQIREALKSSHLTPMRMEPVLLQSGLLFLNDAYNAAPTSMTAALQFMKTTTVRPNKWLVLGDMLELGTNEVVYHEEVARYVCDMDVAGVSLYGPLMRHAYDRLQERDVPFPVYYEEDDLEALASPLRQRADDETLFVLLKGSRGMALERMIHYVKEDVR